MKHNNLKISNKIGLFGEKLAEKYLLDKGFEVLSKNYLEKTGEIDIIAVKNNKIHFVEVKTRSIDMEVRSVDLGNIVFSNIHPQKLKRLHKTIELFLLKNISHETEWQIDILGVYLDLKNKKAKITKIENIC